MSEYEGEEVRIQRHHAAAKIPTRNGNAAGFDLYSVEGGYLGPNEYRLFDTGLSFAMPPDFEGQIRPRSGLAATVGITVLNSPGTIDADYRGPIKVLLINHGRHSYQIIIGDRIAQVVFSRTQTYKPGVRFTPVASLDSTWRGEKGFGSSGQ